MTGKSELLKANRRHFLAIAGSTAVASSFAIAEDSHSADPLPMLTSVSYAITVDVTTSPISYSYSDANGTHNAYRLLVNPADKVTWIVTASKKPCSLTILFVRETPDDATHKTQRYVFSGTDTAATAAMSIDDDGTGTYEYYVGVIDGAGRTYSDDPKIIVGGSGTFEVGELIGDARELVSQAGKLRDIARTNPPIEAQIGSIEKKLQEVIKKLE